MKAISSLFLLWATLLAQGGKPGSVDRPETVGRFGNPHAIRIEGASTFQADEIRDALLRSSSFVLVSHPKAPFEKFVETTRRGVSLGYLAAGFAEPDVTAEWDEKEGALVIRIDEGPRFRMGGVRIVGAKAVRDEKIRWWLIDEERKGQRLNFRGRGEENFRSLAKEKEFSWQVAGVLRGEGAAQAGQGDPVSGTSDDPTAPWSTGKWASFTELQRELIRGVVLYAYEEEGYRFPEVEIDYVDGRGEGTKDLVVRVLDESPLALLGEVTVAGNVVNSTEDILRFLGLKQGMELKGPYEIDLRRRLWSSGRFFGWHIQSWRRPDEAVVNLDLTVAEHWEAPPLFGPLDRSQEALLRFINWFNGYDGDDGDVILHLAESREEGLRTEIAAGLQGELVMRAAFRGRGLSMESTPQGVFRVFLRGKTGRFLASVPIPDSKVMVYASLLDGFVPADPSPAPSDGRNMAAAAFKTGTIKFGAGISSLAGQSRTNLGFDPTLVFKMTGSQGGVDEIIFQEGTVTVKQEGVVLRFEEESGRLVWWKIEDEHATLRVTIERGGLARVRREIDAESEGLANAMDDGDGMALVCAAFAYSLQWMSEMEHLVSVEDVDALLDTLEAAALKTGKMLPLAKKVGGLLNRLGGDDESDAEEGEDVFEIPVEPSDLFGMNLMAMLSAGFYGELARLVEPGTWPDLVLREVLHHLHGNTQYADQTIEVLYKDESMGPIGSLLCAELLHRTGNPAARRFGEKARAALDVRGFAKDWSLVLRGRPAGSGWEFIQLLGEVSQEDVDLILTGANPAFRGEIRQLLEACRELGKDSTVEGMAPVMERLWEKGLGEIVATLVESSLARYAPQVNPAEVAMVVNGIPVPRCAEHVHEWWDLPRLHPGFEEDWITQTLFAQQLWKRGLSVPEANVVKMRKTFVEALGQGDESEGWKKVRAAGISEEQMDWLVGTMMTAIAYGTELQKNEQITDDELRAFYELRPDLFGAVRETHVHRIMIPKAGEGLEPAAQVKLAERIVGRLTLIEDPENLQEAFREEARAHSVGSAADNGGCLQWLVPADWFNEDLAQAIALVPDGGLSKIIDDGRFLYIIHVLSNRRMGKAKPIEEVAGEVRHWAIMDRAAKRLRETADVVRIKPPAEGEVYVEPEPVSGMREKAMDLLGKAMGGDRGEEAGEGDERKEQAVDGMRSELGLVQRKAAEGDALFRYYLGTYHERGVGMPRNLAAARNCYEQAAEAGERKAMLRLAHLYFAGQGVARDVEKALRWREAAKNARD